jgi:hypothetical protein
MVGPFFLSNGWIEPLFYLLIRGGSNEMVSRCTSSAALSSAMLRTGRINTGRVCRQATLVGEASPDKDPDRDKRDRSPCELEKSQEGRESMTSFPHADETFNIGIFLYDGVEELDFCGPFEVLKAAAYFRSERGQSPAWQVFTVAEEPGLLKTSGELLVQPQITRASTSCSFQEVRPTRSWGNQLFSSGPAESPHKPGSIPLSVPGPSCSALPGCWMETR